MQEQISTSPWESPYGCKEPPLHSPSSCPGRTAEEGAGASPCRRTSRVPPSGAEPPSRWRLWPFAPALGAARWVLEGAGGPQPRARGCLWGEVSSLWGSRSGQLLGTPHVHPPTLVLALLPSFGGAWGAFPGHIHPTASHVAPAASLASGRA